MTEESTTPVRRKRTSKKMKHWMEVTRTVCAVIALCLNLAVLTHVIGLW